MPAKVVHVAAHYPPDLGGLEKVVQSLASYRSRLGLPVEVLTSHSGRRTNRAPEAEFVQRLGSIHVAHTTIMPSLVPRLLRLRSDSVVHLHVSQAFTSEVVYLSSLVRKVPYVAHVHIDVGPSGTAGFLLRAYKPYILGPVLRGAEVVVVFTEEQKQAIGVKYHLDPRRIEVIPNGVETAFFAPPRRVRARRPRLLFVGRLAVQKNIGMLLHALDGISERFDTTLVGDGELGGELKALAERLALQNVRFHGRADGEDLLDLFRQADLFVLPSEREGMPLVLLEAMAMGLPTVATDIAGNRDVVIDGQNGRLVPLNDAAAMQRALIELAFDETIYARMSESARKRGERFTWDAVGQDFEGVYARASAGLPLTKITT
jgi:glycosyltransferase involved in cell wall biosynthesis